MAAARTRERETSSASPKSDAYVGLLGISLIALILACTLMALDFYGDYEGKTKAPTVPAYGGLPNVGGAATGIAPPSGGGLAQPPGQPGGLVQPPGGAGQPVPPPGKNP